jgi:hypothetical protein
MDHRCPACGADLGSRKFSQKIVAQMEVDCSHCKKSIQLNLHRAEVVLVFVNFALIVLLGFLAWLRQSQELVFAALASAALGGLALHVLGITLLRNWPRYVLPLKREEKA